jgi:hypothetical protein
VCLWHSSNVLNWGLAGVLAEPTRFAAPLTATGRTGLESQDVTGRSILSPVANLLASAIWHSVRISGTELTYLMDWTQPWPSTALVLLQSVREVLLRAA